MPPVLRTEGRFDHIFDVIVRKWRRPEIESDAVYRYCKGVVQARANNVSSSRMSVSVGSDP